MNVGNCGSCQFWSGPADYNTRCLRHPPVVQPNGESAWPKVEKGNGCGDHQPPHKPWFNVVRVEGDTQWRVQFFTGETIMTTDVPSLAESVCENLNRATRRIE